MGQHADDLIDQMIQADWPFHIPKPKWSTKDGKVMYVEDMTTDHIINSINQFTKQSKEPYWALQAELNKRNT